MKHPSPHAILVKHTSHGASHWPSCTHRVCLSTCYFACWISRVCAELATCMESTTHHACKTSHASKTYYSACMELASTRSALLRACGIGCMHRVLYFLRAELALRACTKLAVCADLLAPRSSKEPAAHRACCSTYLYKHVQSLHPNARL